MTDRTPSTAAGRTHLQWLLAGDDVFPEDALNAVLAIEDEASEAALRAEAEARASLDVPATFPLDLDTFVAGLDSPNHSEQSRRDWCRLFFRDMQRSARAEPRAEGLREALARIRRAAASQASRPYSEDGHIIGPDSLTVADWRAVNAALYDLPFDDAALEEPPT